MNLATATQDDLRLLAAQGAASLEGASAQELLQWTEDTFGSDYIVASNMQDGVLVHLGGSLGFDSAFGRKLRQHKVTSLELGDYIDRVVRHFAKRSPSLRCFTNWRTTRSM